MNKTRLKSEYSCGWSSRGKFHARRIVASSSACARCSGSSSGEKGERGTLSQQFGEELLLPLNGMKGDYDVRLVHLFSFLLPKASIYHEPGMVINNSLLVEGKHTFCLRYPSPSHVDVRPLDEQLHARQSTTFPRSKKAQAWLFEGRRRVSRSTIHHLIYRSTGDIVGAW